MIRIELQLELNYQIDPYGADFVFNFHAANNSHQSVHYENLLVNQPLASRIDTDPGNGTRYLRLRAAPGDLHISYVATIDIKHHQRDPLLIAESPVRELPLHVLGYIYPSRYCESDRLLKFAHAEFGHLPPGYARVIAIRDWVRRQVKFTPNTSTSSTSAVDTLLGRAGICRDFAHLMIALCRALNIPARFTTGTDYGADPTLGPPDFHAYVEVYLGERWYIFDPSGTAIPMGLVRFGTGRDAADVAFATIFGNVQTHAPNIRVLAVQDESIGAQLPQHVSMALSTDAGLPRPEMA